MKVKIFAIRDRATQQYTNPIMLLAPGQAIRLFTDDVNRATDDNPTYKHPDDFDLYEIGEYETDTAKFETHEPTLIAMGKNVAVRNKE